MSAADVAEQQGHREIAVLLRQDEARRTVPMPSTERKEEEGKVE